jgi:hypothetical protein
VGTIQEVSERPAQPSRWATGRTVNAVSAIWILLLVNTVGFARSIDMVVPFPQQLAQVITMSSLFVAFGMALVVNRRMQFRPDAFLLLLSLLVVVSAVSSMSLEAGAGGWFRLLRFAVFVATIWLLTPWWGENLHFVRLTFKFLLVMLTLVVVGLLISPRSAMWGENGRLVGTIWPMHAPRVGQLAAVAIGLAVILWLTRQIDGRSAVVASGLGAVCLLLSHTRTALVALVVGIFVTLVLLLTWSKRVRLTVSSTALVSIAAVALFWPWIEKWFRRGQDAGQLSNLTGRQVVWDAVLAEDRSDFHFLFGTGLGDKAFDGAAIDSSWLAVCLEQGYVGVAVVAAMLLCLSAAVVLRPPSPAVAFAAFLVAFCAVSSYTEVGLGDASTYLLYLALAASLLKSSSIRTRAAVVPVRKHST